MNHYWRQNHYHHCTQDHKSGCSASRIIALFMAHRSWKPSTFFIRVKISEIIEDDEFCKITRAEEKKNHQITMGLAMVNSDSTPKLSHFCETIYGESENYDTNQTERKPLNPGQDKLSKNFGNTDPH